MKEIKYKKEKKVIPIYSCQHTYFAFTCMRLKCFNILFFTCWMNFKHTHFLLILNIQGLANFIIINQMLNINFIQHIFKILSQKAFCIFCRVFRKIRNNSFNSPISNIDSRPYYLLRFLSSLMIYFKGKYFYSV